MRQLLFWGIASVLLLTGWLFVSFAPHLAGPSNRSAVPPNIIYMYADDMGYAELGCYGQQKIRPPNLDKLAQEGMRFTQHYTSMPVCAPARCMLLTGKHSGHSYIRGNYEMAQYPDIIRQADAIVVREHVPIHINEWEIVTPKTITKTTN